MRLMCVTTFIIRFALRSWTLPPWSGCAAGLILAGCATPSAPLVESTPPTAVSTSTVSIDEQFTTWIDKEYETELQFSPIQLTFMGRDELKDQLDDASVSATDKQMAWKAQSVAEMKERFAYDALSADSQMAYDLWIHQYAQMKAARPFINDDFFFHQMDSPHAFLPTFMMNFHRVTTREDLTAYIARLRQFPRFFGQLLARAEIGITERGIRTPAFALEATIEQSSAIVDGQPFSEGKDTDLWANFKGHVTKLKDNETITADEATRFLEEGKLALTEDVLPAYQKIIDWAKRHLEDAPKVVTGVGNQPHGASFYAYRLAQQTTTDKSAEEIHTLGLQEVARIRNEMEAIMAKVEFTGDLQQFFQHIREAEWNYYPDTDEGRQAYIDDATAALDNIEHKLPDFFGILPKAKLVVKRVEAYRERDGAAQHYYPSTPDGSRPGIYYAHLSDMTAMPKNQLEVIAYHEGLPGHHMQIAIAQELESVPKFQTQAFFPAYAEGWALYSEALAKEVPGTYADPYSDFGRLTAEIWRAIRLVVDTGLHAKGWTEKEAIQYFQNNSPEPLESIVSEVRRYIVMPGQATSYKIGMLTIQALRAEAEVRLGSDFNLAEFHDQILGSGALPLNLLERKIQGWAGRASSAPKPQATVQ